MKSTDWVQIDRLRDSLRAPRVDVTHAEDDQVKLVSYDFDDKKRFPDRPTQIEILHLTDLQYGSKGFQRKKFLQYRDWILSSPNRFVLLGGRSH